MSGVVVLNQVISQLVNADGYDLALKDGYAYTSDASAILISGYDRSTNQIHIPNVDKYGSLQTTFSREQLSVFNRVKVSLSFLFSDLINKYEIDSRVYGTSTAGGGSVTHVPTQSAVQLSVGASNNDRARIRTNTFYRYQSGKALSIKISIICADTGKANQIRRWGLFDDNDGVFFELNGTTINAVIRSSVSGSAVDTVFPQSGWSIDKMDGTGKSGITLDVSRGNIYEIELQWLGVGTTRFIIDGFIVHEALHFNSVTSVYMRTAQLPMQCEIVNTAASTASNFIFICSSILIESGNLPHGYTYSAFNPADITVTTTERPVLSIRPKATYNSITNRMLIIPKHLIVSNEGGRAGIRLVMNPASITGASFSSVDSKSGVEFDIAATAITGGETILRSFLPVSTADSLQIDLEHYFSIHGRFLRQDAFATSVDTLVIMAICEQAGSTNVRSSISWDEIR